MPKIGYQQVIQIQDFFKKIYDQPIFLPPIWRVLYQESIRKNHILFRDAKFIHAPNAKPTLPVNKEDLSKITAVVSALFSSHSISQMIDIVNNLNKQQQMILFQLYQIQLSSWQHRQVNQLH